MRRRTSRRLVILLAAVVLVAIAVRLALDPLATWRTRRVLAGLDGMRGTFSDVEVRVLHLSYVIHRLRIEKVAAGGRHLPFLEAERATFGLHWRELFRGHLVARLDLDAPKLNVVQQQKPKEGAPPEAQQIEETPKIGRRLERLAPLRLDRVQVRRGEILFVDASDPKKTPRLWLHAIELTLENFATRPALAKGEPTVLAGRATLQRTGKVSVFASADPLAKKLTFAGQGKLTGLQLTELGEVIAAKAGITPEKGVLDLVLRFQAVDGKITGGVRPIVKDASTKPADPGLGAALKSMMADASLKIFKDDVPGRNAVATTIPIEGTVTDPKAQAVPTIIGILRNAFVQGVTSSLRGLPPPKAKRPEGVLEQARRGLSPKGQPRAQPQTGGS